MAKVLVVFVHPALEKSRVQKRLLKEATGVVGVEIHDLYEAYPDFQVHVRSEQELLAAHDVVVLQ